MLDHLHEVLINEKVISKIDEVRSKYLESATNTSSPTEYTMALVPAIEMFKRSDLGENDRYALEVTLNKILEDLAEITPRYVSSERVLKEDLAVMSAIMEWGNVKKYTVTKEDNVLWLKPGTFRSNAGYLSARNKVFDIIGVYAREMHIPRTLKYTRIEDLLSADVRVQLSKSFEREELSELIVELLEGTQRNDVSAILDKFFSEKNKDTNS